MGDDFSSVCMKLHCSVCCRHVIEKDALNRMPQFARAWKPFKPQTILSVLQCLIHPSCRMHSLSSHTGWSRLYRESWITDRVSRRRMKPFLSCRTLYKIAIFSFCNMLFLQLCWLLRRQTKAALAGIIAAYYRTFQKVPLAC